MTTSLVIASPDIQVKAKYASASQSFGVLAPVENLYSGPRYTFGQLAANQTTINIDFDLGEGNNQNCTYWIMARADRFLAGGGTGTATVYWSDNGTTYTSHHAVVSVTAATGPRTHDYVADITAATLTHRYWRVTLTRSTGANMMHSKMYLGDWFDMGVDPNIEGDKKVIYDSQFKSSSGASRFARGEEQPRRVYIEWQGVTDAKANEFMQTVVKMSTRHTGCFLYTRTVTSLLDGETLLHCKLTDFDTEPMTDKANYNRVRATFEELLG